MHFLLIKGFYYHLLIDTQRFFKILWNSCWFKFSFMCCKHKHLLRFFWNIYLKIVFTSIQLDEPLFSFYFCLNNLKVWKRITNQIKQFKISDNIQHFPFLSMTTWTRWPQGDSLHSTINPKVYNSWVHSFTYNS